MQDIIIKGFNLKEGKDVLLIVNWEGVVLGLEEWECIEEGSVKRYTGKQDRKGKLLFEEDRIQLEEQECMVIRYGIQENFSGFYLEDVNGLTHPFTQIEEYEVTIE